MSKRAADKICTICFLCSFMSGKAAALPRENNNFLLPMATVCGQVGSSPRTTLTLFSPRRAGSRRRFVATLSSAHPNSSRSRSHECVSRADLATLSALRTADDAASVGFLLADSSSIIRKRFALTIYLIFLILHSLALQPTWPAMDIVLYPQFPCEQQYVTSDKLPLVSPGAKTHNGLLGNIFP